MEAFNITEISKLKNDLLNEKKMSGETENKKTVLADMETGFGGHFRPDKQNVRSRGKRIS